MHSHQAKSRWLRWPDTLPGKRLAFGADYNPEQWPRNVWEDDVRAMRAAGVNIVSIGIFSWARLQPTEDTWDFEWLDEIMDLLHLNGIAVDLGTATASPPPWLTTRHPEVLPVDAQGHTIWPGARQHWRPTSAIFRRYALWLVEAMADRYGNHPALAAWHISNELGCHNIYDYSDDAAEAFRTWLQERYKTIDGLNDAWGTAFWSQRYSAWEQILPPRLAASHPNPTQQLDFKRFSSDVLKDYLIAEREVLRRVTPDIPITTNFMVMGEMRGMNYADWADEVDFVSNDHYRQMGPQSVDELSFSANLTGNIAAGNPWFLMEHSTSAVNWQPINQRKRRGELARDSLTHVAHGADAVCYFQWRQSEAGAEKYHSAMLPHAGEDSEVFRSVAQLGRTLEQLNPIAGSRKMKAPVAILFDWDSWWASEKDSHPSEELRYRREALDWYSALLDLGIRADIVPIGSDWSSYPMVIAPVLYLMPRELSDALNTYVQDGGHLVTTYFSGIVDENDHVWLGGYPGALRELLGVRVEEFAPLLANEHVTVDNGTFATMWTEPVQVVRLDVEVIARYDSGDLKGMPAVTRRASGRGSAGYVSARFGSEGLRPLARRFADLAGVATDLPADLVGKVELAVRTTGEEDFWFLINRTEEDLELRIDGNPLSGIDMTGAAATLTARGVAVLRREPARAAQAFAVDLEEERS